MQRIVDAARQTSVTCARAADAIAKSKFDTSAIIDPLAVSPDEVTQIVIRIETSATVVESLARDMDLVLSAMTTNSLLGN